MKNKFKFLALAIMALLSVNVWGADLQVGNTLFTENFRGGDGNAFSAHTYSSTYSSITWFSGNSGDASSISYGGSNVHFSSSTASNMDGTNAWLNKNTTGYVEIDNIPLHNVTKFQAHWAQSAKVAVTFYYKFNGVADWTSGGTTTAQPAADATSNEITVPSGKTSVSIKLQRSDNGTNQRVDKICLVATAVSSGCTAISPTLSYTSAATIGQVLNPTLDKKGSTGAVTYSIKTGGTYATISTTTGVLTCNAAGTVTVQATIAAAGDYCEGTATSNAITISEPSYTITATKNDASLGNVSLSGKVITATPNTCVGYDNSAYTVSPAGKATVAQSGNIFTVSNVTADVTVTINFAELEKDTYVDNLHGNTTIEECGSYTAPLLSDAPKPTTGDCDVVHYHFAGWVTSAISTGTPGAPSGMITAGTNMNSTGEEYIAVWAKEE